MSERKRFHTPTQVNVRKTSAHKRPLSNCNNETTFSSTISSEGHSIKCPPSTGGLKSQINKPNQQLNVRKTSAHKRLLSNHNNETTFSSTISSEGPSIKCPPITGGLKSQIAEIEADISYNDYLQALLKYEIVQKQIKEKENVLNGQISFQENNVTKRKEQLRKIQDDTEHILIKENIMKMIKQLEENIMKLEQMYENYQTQTHAETIFTSLNNKAHTLVLRHIDPIVTEEQYNIFIDSLIKLTCACEKVINSGRDFDGIHNLAEQCNKLSQTGKKIKELQDMFSTIQIHAITSLFQKLSDMFAKQYDSIEH